MHRIVYTTVRMMKRYATAIFPIFPGLYNNPPTWAVFEETRNRAPLHRKLLSMRGCRLNGPMWLTLITTLPSPLCSDRNEEAGFFFLFLFLFSSNIIVKRGKKNGLFLFLFFSHKDLNNLAKSIYYITEIIAALSLWYPRETLVCD